LWHGHPELTLYGPQTTPDASRGGAWPSSGSEVAASHPISPLLFFILFIYFSGSNSNYYLISHKMVPIDHNRSNQIKILKFKCWVKKEVYAARLMGK
jgi:hypothetical protein